MNNEQFFREISFHCRLQREHLQYIKLGKSNAARYELGVPGRKT